MRAYRIVNLVVLGLLFYAALFSVVSPAIEKAVPSLWQCRYKASTGKSCPFCGLTGDMRSFLSTGRLDQPENIRFPLLLWIYLTELILRVFLTAASFRSESRLLYRLDIAAHLAGLSTVFLL